MTGSERKRAMRMARRAMRMQRKTFRYHVRRVTNHWGEVKVVTSYQNRGFAVTFARRGNERRGIPIGGYDAMYVLDTHTGERISGIELYGQVKENKVDWLREGF